MADGLTCVLLLDDCPDVLESFEEWFRLEGWLPVKATTELDAVLALTKWRPSVVVIEPYLSSGDGLVVARAARALLGPDVRVVALSKRSWYDLSGDDRALFDSYVVKPATDRGFREAVGLSTQATRVSHSGQ